MILVRTLIMSKRPNIADTLKLSSQRISMPLLRGGGGKILARGGHPFLKAYSRHSRCPLSMAAALVCSSQGRPHLWASCKHLIWPNPAASKQTVLMPGSSSSDSRSTDSSPAISSASQRINRRINVVQQACRF